ncbi:hypothetical protein N7532_001851 [Penicillium argentinense]|uniref:Uncharacterized protein n=1 Tax=Penicillium argentinense TaxID=1131581 RepID=A0A9W9KMU6_9EURO|nr:uncharacterized protein N7532_001851 [Penicillium argentinense]KAJ5111316.1 hypothetical protein N7532_001851 [Penicillium argentinense]
MLTTTPNGITDLHFADALFMSFSAMTGTGLSVQSTLFALLILGHAFPIFGTIILLRASTLRSAQKLTSRNTTKKQAESQVLQKDGELMTCYRKSALFDSISVEAKAATERIEIQGDVSPHDEHEVPWDNYGQTVVTVSQSPRRVTHVTVDNDEDLGSRKILFMSFKSWSKRVVQRTASHLSCIFAINCNEPGVEQYMALALIAVLIILYFIGFLILGVVSIGLWSKFVRSDIPRNNEASPFGRALFSLHRRSVTTACP